MNSSISRSAAWLFPRRNTPDKNAFRQEVGRQKSRAEPPGGCWPSIAVIRPVLRRDLLDKETNILSGERAQIDRTDR